MKMQPYYLLVNNDCEHCKNLEQVFNFLELPLKSINEAHYVSNTEQQQHCQAVFLCQQLTTRRIDEIIKPLLQQKTQLPCIILGNTEPIKAYPCIIASIESPIQKKCLQPILQRIDSMQTHCADALSPGAQQILNRLVGVSKPIQALRQIILRVANSDTTVLLLGESGTGKEIIASCIHQLSARNNKPFVPVNCGAIPAELMESELFGHEKGAFTGAINRHAGRFELADGGTLFLDEIGDMPLPMQVKLLRVLQEKCFERIGGNTSLESNVRIIAATNQNLELAIKQGRFREDLYYRLNVIPIRIAALRERQQDVPLLLDHFIEVIGQQLQSQLMISDPARNALAHYDWPGNIRELVNLVERLMVMHPDSVIGLSELEQKYQSKTTRQQMTYSTIPQRAKAPINLKQYLANTELTLINEALNQNNGVISHAAKYLSVGRTTLIEKMRKYGVKYSKEKSDAIVEKSHV